VESLGNLPESIPGIYPGATGRLSFTMSLVTVPEVLRMQRKILGVFLTTLLIFVLPAWGGTEEKPITTIRELLRNPQAYFFKEVTLKGDVIQVVSKEAAEKGKDEVTWLILLNDWSTTGVAIIMGVTSKDGAKPVQGDRIRISCSVISYTVYETVLKTTNEAIICLHIEEKHGPIVFLN